MTASPQGESGPAIGSDGFPVEISAVVDASEISSSSRLISPGAAMRLIWPLILMTMMDLVCTATRGLTEFPFLRTLIECNTTHPEGFDTSSTEWSGSRWCGDRCYVAQEAQWLKGMATGFEQAVQCICMPMLGSLADMKGRKGVTSMSLLGSSLSLGLYAIAASVGKGVGAQVLVVLGSVVKGATDTFFMIIWAIVADMFSDSQSRGMAYSLLQTARGVWTAIVLMTTTLAVIRQNWTDYTWFFTTLSVFALASAFLATCVIKETLEEDKRQPATCAGVLPTATYDFFVGEPKLAGISACIFLLFCGVSVLVIVQAYSIAAYGWTQTQSTFALLGLAVVAICSLASSAYLIRCFGARVVFVLGLSLATLGTAILTLASSSVAVFFVGGVCLGSATMSSPAYLAIVSNLVEQQRQAQLQTGIGALAILATAIWVPSYSAMFKELGAGGDCDADSSRKFTFVPFAVAAMFMASAVVTAVVWLRKYPEDAPREEPAGAPEDASVAVEGTGDELGPCAGDEPVVDTADKPSAVRIEVVEDESSQSVSMVPV